MADLVLVLLMAVGGWLLASALVQLWEQRETGEEGPEGDDGEGEVWLGPIGAAVCLAEMADPGRPVRLSVHMQGGVAIEVVVIRQGHDLMVLESTETGRMVVINPEMVLAVEVILE